MTNPYETDELLNQYLAFHYGVDYFDVPNYAVRCAQLCLEFMENRPRRKALDLGCAVGRSTFELALGFDTAVGLDLSARFIQAAQELQQGETLNYFLQDEGDLGRGMQATLSNFNYNDCSKRVEFAQGDACKLGAEHVAYDLIFAGNLIDRVNNPTEFLNDMPHRIVPGGLLVISSPYTLLTEYTPKENWLGGIEENGKPKSMLEGMQAVLAPYFNRVREPLNVPFVIRETARKYQHSIAEMSVWERKAN